MDADCPTCGPTRLEPHPLRLVYRCFNCKEWLADADGQLFVFPLAAYWESLHAQPARQPEETLPGDDVR